MIKTGRKGHKKVTKKKKQLGSGRKLKKPVEDRNKADECKGVPTREPSSTDTNHGKGLPGNEGNWSKPSAGKENANS